MIRNLLSRYEAALRDEPKLRSYVGASIVDDIGVAVTAWAMALLMTDLFTDQRKRASVMLPTLVCFLIGNIVSGPLADWAARRGAAKLAHWRWRVVIGGRALETLALGTLVFGIARGTPTLGSVLPYMMVSALMKTALRPTRQAFEVDLLRKEETQVGADGETLRDEKGAPQVYKTHLLSFGSLTESLRAAATLAGLLLGGRILAATGKTYWPLFVLDVVTNVGFLAALFFACHPTLRARDVRLGHVIRDLDDVEETQPEAPPAPRQGIFRHFGASLRDGFRFLLHKDRRPLLALLSGSFIVEVVTEAYSGKMVIKHVLGGSDDSVRYAEIGWTAVSIIGVALLPALARKVGSLGKIFLVAMLVDGAVIAFAGRIAGLGAASAVVPFAVVLGVDQTLTLCSGALAGLAQNSASSSGMRGRIAAFYTLVVLIGDMAMEVIATGLSEAMGIPAMLVRIGIAQVALVALIAAFGGKRLWSFGLRTEPETRADYLGLSGLSTG